MIETEEQRRWWFATHPQYSWSRRGIKKLRDSKKNKEDPDKVSPEAIDAYVDNALKNERNETVIEILKLLKFWLGTEFASKSPEEQEELLSEDEFDWDRYNEDEEEDEEEEPAGNRQRSNQNRAQADEPQPPSDYGASGGDKDSDKREPSLWKSIVKGIDNTLQDWQHVLSWLGARLPPKGTQERAKIEAARRRGRDARKKEELENIRAGGKGSGVWSDRELKSIRQTGRFPPDTVWHHDPTVANRPDLAADPRAVRPVRGGRKGHFDAHGRDWRKPYK
jgi:hypothetical protein